MNASCYWVYILLCENNTYYTGITNNLEKRYKSHIDGASKCKYTRSFKPLKIAQAWEIPEGKAIAMKVERYIKKLTRCEKEKIIAEPLSLHSIFTI
jgi:putative endonuclease